MILFRARAAAVLLLAANVAHAFGSAQLVLGKEQAHAHNDFGHWEQDLASISSNDFTVVSHPSYPHHSVRLRKVPDFCDPDVKSF